MLLEDDEQELEGQAELWEEVKSEPTVIVDPVDLR